MTMPLFALLRLRYPPNYSDCDERDHGGGVKAKTAGHHLRPIRNGGATATATPSLSRRWPYCLNVTVIASLSPARRGGVRTWGVID